MGVSTLASCCGLIDQVVDPCAMIVTTSACDGFVYFLRRMVPV